MLYYKEQFTIDLLQEVLSHLSNEICNFLGEKKSTYEELHERQTLSDCFWQYSMIDL